LKEKSAKENPPGRTCGSAAKGKNQKSFAKKRRRFKIQENPEGPRLGLVETGKRVPEKKTAEKKKVGTCGREEEFRKLLEEEGH